MPEGKAAAFLRKLLISILPAAAALQKIHIFPQSGFGRTVVQADEPQPLIIQRFQ